MSKKKKPVKVRRNLRTDALASIKKLELDLKRVKENIEHMEHHPHCPTFPFKGHH